MPLVIAALALVLVACSAGDDGRASPTTPAPVTGSGAAPTTAGAAASSSTTAVARTAPPTVAAVPSSCAPARPLPTGRTERTLAVDGVERRYSLHAPPGYDGTTAAPLVLDFHGRGSNFAEQYAYSGFGPIADREGFLLVHPDALGDPQQWNPAGIIDGSYDDIAFVDALLDELAAIGCVDPARVYATGLSSGGFMTSALACTRGDRFAAFGAVAFELHNDALCGRAPSVPIVIFHGTDDDVVPFRGGVNGGARPVARAWAEHDGCRTRPTIERVGDEVRREAWRGCDEPGEVTLFVVEGGGHTWPGSFPVPRLGHVTDDVDASEEIWSLFARHALGG